MPEDLLLSMRIHPLKTDAEPFAAVQARTKTFEFRRNDRDFQAGDLLVMCEHTDEGLTGKYVIARATYILRGPLYGVPEGYVVMSLGPI